MMMRFVGGLLVVAALTAPAVAGEAGGDKLPRQSKQGIESTMKQFERGWNEGKPEQMAQVYAEEARVINPTGKSAEGRQNIQQLFETDMQGNLKDTRVSMTLENTREIDSDHVLADVQMQVRNMPGPDGNRMPQQELHAVVLLERAGNRWQVLDARAFQPMMMPEPPAVGGAGSEGQLPEDAPMQEAPLEDGRMNGQPAQPMPPVEPLRPEVR